MKKFAFFVVMTVLPTAFGFAAEGDLVLPGERWIAKFDKYVCAASGPAVAQPASLDRIKANFEQITADQTSDNFLLKATFKESGATCRYNVLLLVDKAGQTVRLAKSKAYAPAGGSSCAQGKAFFDGAFASNRYLYYGQPQNAAIMIPVAGAEAVCGGQNMIGVNFVLKGRVP